MGFEPASDVLSPYRVLDLTRVRSGPTCVKQLAVWGADVIKIEQPVSDGGDATGKRGSSDFQNLHRNKRSITLNLKHADGLAAYMRLVESANVVVENYRADVKNRLGIGYASLKAANPKIVLLSISGFGQEGPCAGRPGFDQIAQGMGGLMDGEVPGQAGNDHPTSIPTGVFETSDGHVNIACAGGAIWGRFRDTLADERMFADDFVEGEDRSKNRVALNAIINENTRLKSSAEWISILNEAGVPCGEINDISEVFASPQIEHLGMAWDVDSQERGKSKLLGQAIEMANSKSGISQPPPMFGQHTDEILKEAGYTAEDIEAMKAGGAV